MPTGVTHDILTARVEVVSWSAAVRVSTRLLVVYRRRDTALAGTVLVRIG